MPPNLRGILWVGMSGMLFALLNVFTLIPSQHLNPYVMAFMRYFFGTLMLLPIETQAHHMAFAGGRRGTSRDYLANTAAHARALGIHDPYIEDMVERVAHLRGEDVAPSVPPLAAD